MPIGTAIDTSKLKLTFQDEFTTLSASSDGSTGLWQTSLDYGNRTLGSNGEQQYYSDRSVGVDPFTIQNGVLNITAQPGSNPLGLPYNSGAIISKASFSQLYGYFEIRAQMPAGQGLWPAFWLLPADGSWPPELDVFESLGHDPNTLYFSTHSTVQETQGTTLPVANVSDGFHTYGAMWGPAHVTMYIDGIEVAQMPTPDDMHKPMYMLANLAVGGYWPGAPDSTTPFPAHLLIDYVHAYAYPGTSGSHVVDVPPSANVGGTNVAPVVSMSRPSQGDAESTIFLPGVSIADTWPGGIFTATVSSNRGLLNTAGSTEVTAHGKNTTVLTLKGTLDAINADIRSLIYKPITADEADWIWVSATDPQGLQGLASIDTKALAVTLVTPPSGNFVPVVTTPDSLTLPTETIQPLVGIYLSGGTESDPLTVMVSDEQGLIRTHATTNVAEQGEGTASLTLTGSLAAINEELATLTYEASATTGTDWLWVSVTDSTGQQNISPVVVTVTSPSTAPPLQDPAPTLTTPETMALDAGATEVLPGVTVSGAAPHAELTVVVSDSSGSLDTTATPGVTEHGENTTRLTLSGSLEATNAALATLTYKAAATADTDWLWVSVTDANGQTGINPVVVTVNPHLDSATMDNEQSTDAAQALVPSMDSTVHINNATLDLAEPMQFIKATLAVEHGRLATDDRPDVIETGGNTGELILEGSAAAVAAEIAGLIYHGSMPSAGSDQLDTLSIEVRGSAGNYLYHVSMPIFAEHAMLC